MASLPYHEPSIETILKDSSFLLLLNGVNHVLNAALYSGLVGQILMGIAWGAPGGQILALETQEVVTNLGYLGLILLVFEGGLSTSFASLKANFITSSLVATTGIAAPMALSFVLGPLVGASRLQAFAAGAALCSTSLGTTFTLLGTSGLRPTRLGVVLTSAAMMDDVVGLIMVQVISNLGSSSSSLEAVTVIRPVFVSLAFATVLPLVCRVVVLPVTGKIAAARERSPTSLLSRVAGHELTALCIHTATLIGTVTGATYAGTSGLLGAYIAGAVISWWDAEAPHPCRQTRSGETPSGEVETETGTDIRLRTVNRPSEPTPSATDDTSQPSHAGADTYDKYYQPAVERILKPFFFASIGFSIPIKLMFTGSVVWRGLVYTVLMTAAKLICGLWLLRVPNVFDKLRPAAHLVKNAVARKRQARQPREPAAPPTSREEKPLSVYPGLILGSAMVSRGEIGYLISSIAEGGVFSRDSSMGKRADADTSQRQPSEIFLIVTWAITICTILGPVSMGLLVDRVRKLEKKTDGARSNVLGSWGVS